MCCNYCFYFDECKKSKKTSSDCCTECAEYEYCPFVSGESASKGFDSSLNDADSDLDIFEGDEI